MKSKYISTQSNELLSYFNGQNKNCFDDNRFSEDLDFTLLNNDASPLRQTQGGAGSAQATNKQIFVWFKETFEYVLEEANIRLEIIENNEHEDGGTNFYISYVGPLGGLGNNKSCHLFRLH